MKKLLILIFAATLFFSCSQKTTAVLSNSKINNGSDTIRITNVQDAKNYLQGRITYPHKVVILDRNLFLQLMR